MARFILIWALIGQTVPLFFMYTMPYAAKLWWDYRIILVFWPSSILSLGLQDNGNPGDDQITAISILLNAILYAVIGLAIWFLFLRKKQGMSRDA